MNDRRDPTLARDLAALREVHVIREWNPLRDRRAHAAKPAAAQAPVAPSAPAGGALHAARDAAYRWLRWQADRSFRRRAVAALDGLNTRSRVKRRDWPAAGSRISGTRWARPLPGRRGKKARYLRMLRREADVLCAASQGFLEMMGFEDAGLRFVQRLRPRGPAPRRRPRPHARAGCAWSTAACSAWGARA